MWQWTLVQFTYDELSRWNNQQTQARFDWRDDWSQEWILEFWGPKQTLRRGPKTLTKYVAFHVYNKWSKKWAHGPYNCWSHIKTGAPILWSCNTETLFAERKLNLLIFFCEFASALKPVSHCKLFDVIWFSLFFVYALLVEGLFGTFILTNIWIASEFIKCDCRALFLSLTKIVLKLPKKIKSFRSKCMKI